MLEGPPPRGALATGLPLLRAGDPDAQLDGDDEVAGRSGDDGRPRGEGGVRRRPRGAVAGEERGAEQATAASAAVPSHAPFCDDVGDCGNRSMLHPRAGSLVVCDLLAATSVKPIVDSLPRMQRTSAFEGLCLK